MKEKRKKEQKNKQRQKRAKENRSYSERVRAKWFCCPFKLGLSWLNKYNLNKPKFDLRYADDILASFNNEQYSPNF